MATGVVIVKLALELWRRRRQGLGTMPNDAGRTETGQTSREERLAAKLRENLKRRKAQARARRASETAAEDTPPPAQADTPRS